MTKRFGFTLAEVLITLGIIGVVAAMTMPTLMNQTNGAQYKAAYKKALSAIAQGVTLNVALDGGSFADAVKGEAGKTTKPSTGDSIASLLNARMNIVNATGTAREDITTPTGAPALPTVDTYLYFNDGSMFAFDNSPTNADGDKDLTCTLITDGGATANVCLGYIDVNGLKGPNRVIACNTASNTKATYTAAGKDDTVESCEVGNVTDIYPVAFYDQTIVPATNAAQAVLYGK